MRVLLVTTMIAMTTGAQAQVSSGGGPQTSERRGWFGISLSCEECFVLRGPDRVAYVRHPQVTTVEGNSPAAQAGMRRGDSLIAVEGMSLLTADGFQRYAEARAGQPIRVTVRNDGQTRELTVTPAERSSASTIREFYISRLRIAQRRGPDALRAGFRSPMGTLGMTIACERCTETSYGALRPWQFREPAAIHLVDVDGPAHHAGLRGGDTIMAIDGVELINPEAGRMFAGLEPGQRVVLTLRRGGRERQATLTAAVRPDATRDEIAVFEEFRELRRVWEARQREALETMHDIAEIQVVPRLIRMQPNAQVNLAATVYGTDGMPRAVPVRWVSNNINVVQVSREGVARALAPGSAVVQAIIEAGGRRRFGQATVIVQRDGAVPIMPTPPVTPGEPAGPGLMPPAARIAPDSFVKANVDCSEPAVNAINPARACYDERPNPQRMPPVAAPAACDEHRTASPLILNVQVSETGTVLEVQPFAPSNCHEFTEAAMLAARSMTFSPATQGGRPVRAWTLVRMRPAPRTP